MVTIYSSNGDVLFYERVIDNELEWNSMSSGVFLYSITMDDIVLKTGKFIVK